MEEIILHKTDTTAQAVFYSKTCKIEITGIFIPENPYDVFEELKTETLAKFNSCLNPQIHLRLEYFNTASAKYLLQFLQSCISEFKPEIYWYYQEDDEDILEAGKDYEYLTEHQFKFIST
jgi:hypothetical protein